MLVEMKQSFQKSNSVKYEISNGRYIHVQMIANAENVP